MRVGRFRDGDHTFWAEVGEGSAQPLSAAPWEGGRADGTPRPLADLERLAPVQPTKIVCVGRNYREHAAELGNAVPEAPLLFLKPPSALQAPGGPIEVPAGIGEVHHEAELGVVLGRRLRGPVSEAEALAAVAGLCAVNDVTARTIQRQENKFTRAKGFDTFCPVGPWLLLGADATADRAVRCRVNGEERQLGRTSQMVHGVGALLAFVASVMTLEPGDLVVTGTPAGVGPLVPGDRVEVEVEGVGVLESPVVARP